MGSNFYEERYDADEGRWYNISDPIPMTEQDLTLLTEGYLTGAYHGDTFRALGAPTHWVVRRGPYHIVPEWDYMDVVAVAENGTMRASMVVSTRKDAVRITEGRFNNLVAKLSDPNHDITKIKKSYF